MDAEFTVELGADDPTLAVPWASHDDAVCYFDLAADPEQIVRLPEVVQFPELGPILRALNSPASPFRTAKCDAWFDTLMDVDDEPYQATIKCASYIDLYFAGKWKLADFAEHESKAKRMVQTLRAMPEGCARVEVAVRRCYFMEDLEATEGFYWTVYVFGYGDEMLQARAAWSSALTCLGETLLAGVVPPPMSV